MSDSVLIVKIQHAGTTYGSGKILLSYNRTLKTAVVTSLSYSGGRGPVCILSAPLVSDHNKQIGQEQQILFRHPLTGPKVLKSTSYLPPG